MDQKILFTNFITQKTVSYNNYLKEEWINIYINIQTVHISNMYNKI